MTGHRGVHRSRSLFADPSGGDSTIVKKGFKLVLALAVVAAVGFVALSIPAKAQEAIRIGTSSVGSTFYVIAVGLSELLRKRVSLNATVEPLGGSHANMFGLAAKKVDFAIANAGAAFERFVGNRPFKERLNVGLVAQGQASFRYVLVRRDSGITRPEDLIGKTIIAKRRSLPELEKIGNALIKVYNLPRDKIKFVATVNSGQANKVIRAGSVQAAIFPGGKKMPIVAKLFRDGVVDFLYLPEAKVDEMMALLPKSFYKGRIRAGNFKGQGKDLVTFTLNTCLVAGPDVHEEIVYIRKSAVGQRRGKSTERGIRILVWR
ncbi:MAG: TAXI family TRAP transporter solute-binding subunit [Nitrospinota bacterium]